MSETHERRRDKQVGTFYDEATMDRVDILWAQDRKVGERQRYVDDEGKVWETAFATRSVTYLRRV